MPNKGAALSSDDLYLMVEDMMKEGARKYGFGQVPVSKIAPFRERTRLRLSVSDDALTDVDVIEHRVSAREVIGDLANFFFPTCEEGLIVFELGRDTKGRSYKERCRLAAAAIGNTNGRHWQQTRGKELKRLIAEELYLLIYYPDQALTAKE